MAQSDRPALAAITSIAAAIACLALVISIARPSELNSQRYPGIEARFSEHSPPSSTSDSRARVSVLDSVMVQVVSAASGASLPDANWTATSSRQTFGGADHSGWIKVPSSLEVPIVVQAQRHVPLEIYPDDLINASTVELVPSREVSGSFVDAENVRAPPGIAIFAIDADSWPGTHGTDLSLSDKPVVYTDTAGEFVFRNLPATIDFVVVAASEGVASEPKLVRSSLIDANVLLRGGRVFSANLRLVDETTKSTISANPRASGQGIGIREAHAGPRLIRPTRLPAVVAGLVGAPVQVSGSLDQTLLYVFSGFSSSTPLDIDISILVPGYETSHAALTYAATGAGARRQVIELTPIVDGWGSARVSVEWNGPFSLTREAQLLTLRLAPTENSHDLPAWIEIPLEMTQESQTITGIPIGEYKASLRVRHGLIELLPTNFEPGVVQVDKSSVSELEFSLAGLRSVELIISDSSLADYQGRFAGVLLRSAVNGEEPIHFHFDGPPYRFVGLPEGEYRFMVDPPVMYPPPVNPELAGAPFQVGGDGPQIVHDLEVKF